MAQTDVSTTKMFGPRADNRFPPPTPTPPPSLHARTRSQQTNNDQCSWTGQCLSQFQLVGRCRRGLVGKHWISIYGCWVSINESINFISLVGVSPEARPLAAMCACARLVSSVLLNTEQGTTGLLEQRGRYLTSLSHSVTRVISVRHVLGHDICDTSSYPAFDDRVDSESAVRYKLPCSTSLCMRGSDHRWVANYTVHCLKHKFDTLSAIYQVFDIKNKIGPRTDPWGPHSVLLWNWASHTY